jgi:hypothetical protein
MKGGSGTTPLFTISGKAFRSLDLRHLGYRWPTDTSHKCIPELTKNAFESSVMDGDVPFR